MTKKSTHKKLWIVLGAAALVIIALAAVCGIYVSDYYHADADAMRVAAGSSDYADVSIYHEGDALVFAPEDPQAVFVFYPGGKVQYESYAPLMEQIASYGIVCVLPHLTGNLAFLEMNAADDCFALFPEISARYIGGHSLGGVAATSYAVKHASSLSGLIYLASYPGSDIRNSSLRVLSVYGSNDEVVGQEKYAEVLSKMPTDFTGKVIEGGCHAYFGNYGEQAGDGAATISRAEQQSVAAKDIAQFILGS